MTAPPNSAQHPTAALRGGIPLLILNGTVGVGKTTVGEAIADALVSRSVPHAFIDRDAFCRSWPPVGRHNEELAIRNIGSTWRNYQDVGIDRLIVSGVVERKEDLDRFEEAVPGAEIVMCRVRAPQAIREARLKGRDRGESLRWHLARTVELEEILDRVSLEDFEVVNDGNSPEEVALEVLTRIGWIDDSDE